MQIECIETEIFDNYPDAKIYIDMHKSEGRACLVTNCNDGFIVDIYAEQHNL